MPSRRVTQTAATATPQCSGRRPRTRRSWPRRRPTARWMMHRGADAEQDGADGLDPRQHVEHGRRGHADLRDHHLRLITHALELLVGEREGRGDGDAVTGVDSHGVDVLDGVLAGACDEIYQLFRKSLARLHLLSFAQSMC